MPISAPEKVRGRSRRIENHKKFLALVKTQHKYSHIPAPLKDRIALLKVFIRARSFLFCKERDMAKKFVT
jgi:hypothetical protein